MAAADEAKTSRLQSSSWQARFGPEAGNLPTAASLRARGRVQSQEVAGFIRSLPTSWADEQLLVYLISQNVTHRGTDVRLSNQAPMIASDFCRRTVDPTMWSWKVVMSHKRPGHITLLELVAILDLLKRQSRTNEWHSSNVLVLVDNQAVIAVLAKGRSSARQLQGPLRRVASLMLMGHFRLLVAWVMSEWNPADGPSRWVGRRALRDA